MSVIAYGSYALGDMTPHSDLDVAAVVLHPLDGARALGLAGAVSHDQLPVPARKLELVVYALGDAKRLGPQPRFELNLNSGKDGTQADLLPRPGDPDWFTIDLALARAHGVPLFGPAPAEVIGEVPREALFPALIEVVEWFFHELPGDPDTVLVACRNWRYANEGVWSSKRQAGEWALPRTHDTEAVERALLAHHADATVVVGEALEALKAPP